MTDTERLEKLETTIAYQEQAIEGLGRRASQLDQDELGGLRPDREGAGEVLVLAA